MIGYKMEQANLGKRGNEILKTLSLKNQNEAILISSFLLRLTSSEDSIINTQPSSSSSLFPRTFATEDMEVTNNVQILKDGISALHGIRGHYLRENNNTLKNDEKFLILLKMLETGQNYCEVEKCAKKIIKKQVGVLASRFAHQLLLEINEFDLFLSNMEVRDRK